MAEGESAYLMSSEVSGNSQSAFFLELIST
jgi:hypothetical protein